MKPLHAQVVLLAWTPRILAALRVIRGHIEMHQGYIKLILLSSVIPLKLQVEDV